MRPQRIHQHRALTDQLFTAAMQQLVACCSAVLIGTNRDVMAITKRSMQKLIVSLVFVAFFALIILPALDHRFGWSPVAPWASLLGDVIIVLTFLFMFWVIKVNSFAASNIRVEEGQQVIDTGPYAYVRHPMYAGAFWLLVGIPLALGSWWGLGLIVPFLPVLLWRLLDEEKILNAQLRGYTEYTQRVRYRLIPFVW
jgi:protein-S-isoprenylcysteine O-methyltransferase Ste14